MIQDPEAEQNSNTSNVILYQASPTSSVPSVGDSNTSNVILYQVSFAIPVNKLKYSNTSNVILYQNLIGCVDKTPVFKYI